MRDRGSLWTQRLFPVRKQLLMNLSYEKGGDHSFLSMLIINYFTKFPEAVLPRHEAHTLQGEG